MHDLLKISLWPRSINENQELGPGLDSKTLSDFDWTTANMWAGRRLLDGAHYISAPRTDARLFQPSSTIFEHSWPQDQLSHPAPISGGYHPEVESTLEGVAEGFDTSELTAPSELEVDFHNLETENLHVVAPMLPLRISQGFQSENAEDSHASEMPFAPQRSIYLGNRAVGDAVIKNETVRGKRVGRSSQAKRWTSKEEVLFLGSVYVVFVEKGSLFPEKRKGKSFGEYTKQCESDTFERVNVMFNRCKNQTGQKSLPPRTSKALCRHFKQMKQRYISKASRMGENELGFLPLVEEWMALCGEDVFGFPQKVWFPARHSKNTWSITEEVILVGVVVERFFSRGSLCTNKHRRGSLHCWSEIRVLYNRAWTRLNLEKPKDRSADQLSRHYKKVKQRMAQLKVMPGLRPYVQAYRLFQQGHAPDEVFWFHED